MAVNDNKVENKVETVEKAEEKKPELPNTKEGRLVKELL
jgi:NADH-quinone oxidoreductase subunit C